MQNKLSELKRTLVENNKTTKYILEDDSVLIVPKDTCHNIVNDGTEDMKLYTIYTVAQHEPNVIHRTKVRLVLVLNSI